MILKANLWRQFIHGGEGADCGMEKPVDVESSPRQCRQAGPDAILQLQESGLKEGSGGVKYCFGINRLKRETKTWIT